MRGVGGKKTRLVLGTCWGEETGGGSPSRKKREKKESRKARRRNSKPSETKPEEKRTCSFLEKKGGKGGGGRVGRKREYPILSASARTEERNLYEEESSLYPTQKGGRCIHQTLYEEGSSSTTNMRKEGGRADFQGKEKKMRGSFHSGENHLLLDREKKKSKGRRRCVILLTEKKGSTA